MSIDIRRQIEELEHLTVGQLRARYEALFREPTRSSNRAHLIRRIAWRLQAREQGGLSRRALQRAAELSDELGLRLSAPKARDVSASANKRPGQGNDRKVRFAPGTLFVRRYKGRVIEVAVTEEGFRFEGEIYSSLSAIARTVTGARWSGRVFFGLSPRRRKP